MGDCAESFAEVKMTSILLPLSTEPALVIAKCNQDGQTQFVLGKSTLAIPSQLFDLHTPVNDVHEDLPHNFL